MMSNTYLRWLVLVLIFAVPPLALYVAGWAFFPYIVGKNLLFRVITEVAFGTWLLLLLLGGVPRPRFSVVYITLVTFVGVVALADFMGVAPLKSFWSNFERMDGLIMLLHGAAYSVVVGSMLNTQLLWERFWQWSLTISSLVSIGALLDLGGSVTRIAGSTGNPIYLAVYVLFHIFIAALLLRRSTGRVLPYMYSALMLLYIITLWFTGTRGALLGLVVGSVVTALSIIVFARKSQGREYQLWRRASLGLIACMLVLVSVFVAVKDSEFAQSNTMFARLTSMSLSSDDVQSSGARRLMVWRIAWQGVQERPLLGWGQENFNYVFNKYYNPNMHGAESWYDRTHNILLDWLIAAGVLGLFAYVSLYASMFFIIIKTPILDGIERSIMVGLLVAYGVHNLFVFDHIISYILFFTLLAWVHRIDSFTKERLLQTALLQSKSQYIAVLIGMPLMVVIAVYSINYASYMQNRTLLQALLASQQLSTIDVSRELFLEAISYNVGGTQEAREQFVQAAARIAQQREVSQVTKEAFTNAAIAQMQEQARLYPADARFPHLLGGTLSAYGAHRLATPFLERALELSPAKVSFFVDLGHNAAAQSQYKRAQEYYQQAFNLAPGNLQIQQYVVQATNDLQRAL